MNDPQLSDVDISKRLLDALCSVGMTIDDALQIIHDPNLARATVEMIRTSSQIEVGKPFFFNLIRGNEPTTIGWLDLRIKWCPLYRNCVVICPNNEPDFHVELNSLSYRPVGPELSAKVDIKPPFGLVLCKTAPTLPKI